MKSTIKETSGKSEKTCFPILKRLIGKETFVVLFTSEMAGICVFSSIKNREIGEVSDSWARCSDKKVWEDFKGKVILEN